MIFLGIAIRISGVDSHFESVSDSFFFVLLSFVGSAPWEVVSSMAIGKLEVFSAFVILQYVLVCTFIAVSATEMTRIWLTTTTFLTTRWSRYSSTVSSRVKSKLESEDSRSWLKEHLPGWYYRVTVPYRIFRRKVDESQKQELKSLGFSAQTEPLLIRKSHTHALDSLGEVSTDFKSRIDRIREGLRIESTVIEERLREIYSIVTDISGRYVGN